MIETKINNGHIQTKFSGDTPTILKDLQIICISIIDYLANDDKERYNNLISLFISTLLDSADTQVISSENSLDSKLIVS